MNKGKMLLAMAAAGLAACAGAAVPGTVTTSTGRQTGMVSWSQASRKYVVTQNRGGATTSTEIKQADAIEIEIQKPRELDSAIKSRNKSALAGIVKTYSHLQWDIPAAAALSDMHLADGSKAEALKLCKDVVRTTPDASWKGELAPAYWRALLANGMSSDLEKELAKALKGGDRYSSAAALILRGDMIMKQGRSPRNARKALLDGYLRVILLYTEEEVASRLGAEACRKAADCFEAMGNAGRAADLRAKAR